MPQKQKQKQTVRQTVNVNIGTVPKRRKPVRVMRRNLYQRITQQNLRESSRRDGVAYAMSRIGGYDKLRNMKLPYETLEASVMRPRNTIEFSDPEPQRVNALGKLSNTKPNDVPRTRRAYLKDDFKTPARMRGESPILGIDTRIALPSPPVSSDDEKPRRMFEVPAIKPLPAPKSRKSRVAGRTREMYNLMEHNPQGRRGLAVATYDLSPQSQRFKKAFNIV